MKVVDFMEKITDCQEYSYRSSVFEDSLDTDFKKEHGIYYTDVGLAKIIIEDLNITTTSYILDPCCGTGSFLFAAKELGYLNIHGADFDRSTTAMCRKLTGLKDIKTLDTLGSSCKKICKSFNLKDKVDVIIGNPPYAPMDKNIIIDTEDYLFLRNVKDSGSNLFIAALYKALELVKDEGYISYIIPKNFLHIASYKLLRQKILKEKTIISIIDLGSYFKGVRGEQIVLTIKNKKAVNNLISIKKLNNNTFKETVKVEQDFYDDEILLFQNDTDYEIYKKLESAYQRFGDICTEKIHRGRSKSENAISGKDIKKFGFKNVDVPKKGNLVFIQNIYSAEAGIIASFAGNLEATETVTIFKDGDEKMCRYIVGILHSRLCNYYLLKFCYNNSRLTMHTDSKYLKKIPLIRNDATFNQIINIVKLLETSEYMSDEWFASVEALNSFVYETYNICEKEKKYIDSEMKSMQSKRWNNDK